MDSEASSSSGAAASCNSSGNASCSSGGGGGGKSRARNPTNKRRTAPKAQQLQQTSSSPVRQDVQGNNNNHCPPPSSSQPPSPPGTAPNSGPQQQGGRPPGSGDESEEASPSPSRTPRSKTPGSTNKSKGAGARRSRKASASPVMIEDIIEGFAITSFKTLEDLEAQTQLDLEQSQVMTQGYCLLSVPSTPTTPQTGPNSITFPAAVTEPASSEVTSTNSRPSTPSPCLTSTTTTVVTTTSTTTDSNNLTSLITSLSSAISVAATTTNAITQQLSSTLAPSNANMHLDTAPHDHVKVSNKSTTSKSEKAKKDGSNKKSKKCPVSVPSAPQVPPPPPPLLVHNDSSASPCSKENKTHSNNSNGKKGHSTGTKHNSSLLTSPVNCVNNNKASIPPALTTTTVTLTPTGKLLDTKPAVLLLPSAEHHVVQHVAQPNNKAAVLAAAVGSYPHGPSPGNNDTATPVDVNVKQEHHHHQIDAAAIKLEKPDVVVGKVHHGPPNLNNNHHIPHHNHHPHPLHPHHLPHLNVNHPNNHLLPPGKEQPQTLNGPSFPKENNVIKNERSPHSVLLKGHHHHHHGHHPHLPPHPLAVPPCPSLGKDPSRIPLLHKDSLAEDAAILRQNGQSLLPPPPSCGSLSSGSSLSLSSVASDRSSSRDQLSDASGPGRSFTCDSECELDCKASDAGSESLFISHAGGKNREKNLVPPLHNGIIHPLARGSPGLKAGSGSAVGAGSNPTLSSHGLAPYPGGLLKVPAATTASLTAVTATTTTASVSVLTSTTAVTHTTATPVTTSNSPFSAAFPLAAAAAPCLNSSSSSSSLSSTSASSAKPHRVKQSRTPVPSLPSSSSSSSLHSKSASSSPVVPPVSSTSSQSLPSAHRPGTPRSHTPVHREQPRPIPGLSGTRPEDLRELDGHAREQQLTTTPLRPFSTGPAWRSSSLPPPPSSQLPPSSPHVGLPPPSAPGAPGVVAPSLTGLHHTTSGPPAPGAAATALQHHPPGTPLAPPPGPPPHHPAAPPAAPPGLPAHSMFAPPIAPPSALTSSALQVHNPLGVDPLTPALSASHDLLARSAQDRFDNPLRLPVSPFLSSFHQHQHHHQHMHHYGPPPFPSPGSALQLKATPSSLIRPPPSLPDLPPERHKLDKSPLYRPGLPNLPGPLGMSPMLPPPGLPSATPLGSSLHGAFQPKSGGASSSLHPSPLLLPLQREKSQGPSVTPVKKSGKWCAAHVRIAWEIHLHQQKHSDLSRSSEGKASDLLRPPSHLLSGAGLHRPEHGGPMALLGPQGSHSRSPFDSSHPSPHGGSLFNPSHLGGLPFPRSSSFSGLAGLNSSGFGGLGSIGAASVYPPGRDMPSLPGISSPHEWNRLHRTPPSFPTPPAWPPKSDLERERDKERELERERERDREARERERERDKARERERDRSVSRESHHNNHREESAHRDRDSKDLSHRERDRERLIREKDHDLILKRSPSRETDRSSSYEDRNRNHRVLDRLERSRSRSPLRNGPIDPQRKSDGSPFTHGSPQLRGDVRVKEEKREEAALMDEVNKGRRSVDMRQELLQKMDPRSMLLSSHTGLAGLYPPGASDRARPPGVYGSPYDRPPGHPALWHPFDINHRSDIEREREQLLFRMTNPLGLPVSSAPPGLSLLETEKLREHQELLLRDHALRERERDRLALMERERVLASLSGHLDMERTKVPPPLRPADSYHPAFGGPLPNSSYHPSAASRPPSNSSYHHPSGASRPPSSPVVINHNSNTSSSSKSNSPSIVGAPPPLIPSSATLNNHSGGGSPAPTNKVKPPTPIVSAMALDNNVKDKVELTSNGLDSDSQAR